MTTRIIKAFQQSLVDLDALLEAMTKEKLDQAEKPGDWTIRQILHHLAGDCDVYSFIIKRALVESGSSYFFGDFPGNEAWGDRLDFHKRPVEPALALMHAHRAYLAELVGHFPERMAQKIAFFNEKGEPLGERTVTQMITMLTEHMQEHTATIQRILAKEE